MTGLGNRDDERIAKVENNLRAASRIIGSLLIAFLMIFALFLGVLEFHMPMEGTGIAALAVLLVWIVLVFRYQRTIQHEAGLYDHEILRKTIDAEHRLWRWNYIFFFILVGFLAAILTAGPLQPFPSHPLTMSGPLVLGVPAHHVFRGSLAPLEFYFALFAVLAALQVCFGPSFLARDRRRALNDEHTRALQHSAAMFGYPLCVILMCAVLGVLAVRPQWGLMIMPGAITAAVILPGLYFLIRQWRADRDG